MMTTTKAHCCPASVRAVCVSLRSLTGDWERDGLGSVSAGRQEKWEHECNLGI